MGLCALTAEGPGPFMVGELRSHKLSSEAKKTDVILFCYAVNHWFMTQLSEWKWNLHLKIPI